MNKTFYKADITIIGAGVVGLAIASELASPGREVYLLEKNGTFGKEQSSRSSEVIHAGIYYDKNSLKTRLCLEGNRLLYELCQRNGIACKNCGKIMIATNKDEEEKLGKLFLRAKENGVPLKMLSSREMKLLEPNLQAVAAFLSPTTGVIDSHGLMTYFMGKAKSNGVHIACNTEVTGLEKASEGYKVKIGNSSGDFSYTSRILINCAGLHSDLVAQMAGIDIEKAKYKIDWFKGEFYSVSGGKNKLINRLIYQVPIGVSVGVHVCLDVNWRLRMGPYFYHVDELSYKVDEARKAEFTGSSIMKALPFIEPSDLESESSGIMAMLQNSGEDFRDFIIRHEYDKGLYGFVNLVGIDSPGLTSSPAIARYVSRLVNELENS